jgi:cell division protein FtsL
MEQLVVSAPLSSNILSLLLYAALIYFALYSLIITYHWMRWCIGYNMKVWSLAVYFAGSFLLLSVLIGVYATL